MLAFLRRLLQPRCRACGQQLPNGTRWCPDCEAFELNEERRIPKDALRPYSRDGKFLGGH